jgi:flagellar biosynthesis GTPase FlhF
MNIFDKLTINKIYLEYDQEIFNKYDTIAIDSTTGTGKTTSTAKYSKH